MTGDDLSHKSMNTEKSENECFSSTSKIRSHKSWCFSATEKFPQLKYVLLNNI